MGTGIAQVAAMKGLNVILCDSHSGALERSVINTERYFKRAVSKEKLTQEDAEAAAQRISASSDLQVWATCHKSWLAAPSVVSNEQVLRHQAGHQKFLSISLAQLPPPSGIVPCSA